MKTTDAIKQLKQLQTDHGIVIVELTSSELVAYLQYLQKNHKMKTIPGIQGFSTKVVVGTAGARTRPIRGSDPRPKKYIGEKPKRLPEYA